MRLIAAVLLACLCAAPASAQGLERSQSIWRGVSWGALAAGVVLKTSEAWQEPDRKKAFAREALIFTGTNLATWAAKASRDKARPCAPADCGSDAPYKSWWSGHAGNGCAAIPVKSGPAVAIAGSLLAFAVIEGRILGNRHWPIDTVAGCAAGIGNNLLISRLWR